MAPRGYSRTQIILHWAMAALVALQYLLAEGIAQAFELGLREGRFNLDGAVLAHMVFGALIFTLMIWRWLVRRERGVPPPHEDEPAWQHNLARGTHFAAYAIVLLLPVTGAIAWSSASHAAADMHGALRAALLAVIILHIAGALHGQYVRRTGTLTRMLRPDDE